MRANIFSFTDIFVQGKNHSHGLSKNLMKSQAVTASGSGGMAIREMSGTKYRVQSRHRIVRGDP